MHKDARSNTVKGSAAKSGKQAVNRLQQARRPAPGPVGGSTTRRRTRRGRGQTAAARPAAQRPRRRCGQAAALGRRRPARVVCACSVSVCWVCASACCGCFFSARREAAGCIAGRRVIDAGGLAHSPAPRRWRAAAGWRRSRGTAACRGRRRPAAGEGRPRAFEIGSKLGGGLLARALRTARARRCSALCCMCCAGCAELHVAARAAPQAVGCAGR